MKKKILYDYLHFTSKQKKKNTLKMSKRMKNPQYRFLYVLRFMHSSGSSIFIEATVYQYGFLCGFHFLSFVFYGTNKDKLLFYC